MKQPPKPVDGKSAKEAKAETKEAAKAIPAPATITEVTPAPAQKPVAKAQITYASA